jgi:hypothetical protein
MIYLVFYPLAQLDPPQMIKLRSPCAPYWLNLLAYTSFVTRACFSKLDALLALLRMNIGVKHALLVAHDAINTIVLKWTDSRFWCR